MSEPKTATSFNYPLVGEVREFSVKATSAGFTMASGMAYQAAWEREKAHRDRIRAVLRRFLQDEIMIQQMVAELYKAETE